MAAPINPKVTASTVGGAVVALIVALIEWLAGTDVPAAVEVPAIALGIFASGWLQPAGGGGRHVAGQ